MHPTVTPKALADWLDAKAQDMLKQFVADFRGQFCRGHGQGVWADGVDQAGVAEKTFRAALETIAPTLALIIQEPDSFVVFRYTPRATWGTFDPAPPYPATCEPSGPAYAGDVFKEVAFDTEDRALEAIMFARRQHPAHHFAIRRKLAPCAEVVRFSPK